MSNIEDLYMWPALLGVMRRWFGAKRDMATTEKQWASMWAERERETTRERKLLHTIAQYLQMAEKQGAIKWNGVRHCDSPDDPTSEEEIEEASRLALRRIELHQYEDSLHRQGAAARQQDADNHAAWLEATKDERAEKARLDVERKLAHREACRERLRIRREQKAKVVVSEVGVAEAWGAHTIDIWVREDNMWAIRIVGGRRREDGVTVFYGETREEVFAAALAAAPKGTK